MCRTRIARLLAGCALLGLAGCGSSTPQLSMQGEEIPMPPAYGLYAYDGDNLTRLDGSGDWERSTWGDRSDLPTKVEFLVYEPTVATDPTSLSNLILLRRVAHVRNQVNASGQVAPAQNSRWGAPDLPDYRVALNYTPAPGHPDIIVAKPSDELSEGLYSFSILSRPQPINARFGVGWPDVDQTQYAAAHCVDSYPSGYRRCADSDARINDPAAGIAPTAMPVTAPATGATVATTTLGPASGPVTDSPLAFLTVRGLRSSRTTIAGTPVLVVEGDLVNTSSDPHALPRRFVLGLLGSDGTVIENISIADLPPTVLSPSEVYHFRTEVPNPPENAARIRLTPAG
jgi:hypothetical protein